MTAPTETEPLSGDTWALWGDRGGVALKIHVGSLSDCKTQQRIRQWEGWKNLAICKMGEVRS